jgi:DNA-binding IclR family transcriptional regulator
VLDKSVAILEAVERGARTLRDLTDRTEISRPTAHRLASALEVHGFLTRDSGGLRLGPRLFALASSATENLPLRQLARPALTSLSQTTGESAQLFVRASDSRICVEVAESDQELRTIVPVGASLPLTLGSAGKVFLAWGPQQTTDRLIREGNLPKRGALRPEDRLRQALATARRRGWAESVEEREKGVASVSAPVFHRDGGVMAVVSVSGPVGRLGRMPGKHYANAVMTAARQIEKATGTGR